MCTRQLLWGRILSHHPPHTAASPGRHFVLGGPPRPQCGAERSRGRCSARPGPLMAHAPARPVRAAGGRRCRAGSGGSWAWQPGCSREPLPVMEAKKMNLPRGPDNLCFDKDEFMKVAGGSEGAPVG